MSGQVTRCATCRAHDLPCGVGVHRNPLMPYLQLLPTTHVTPEMAAGPSTRFVPVVVPAPAPPDPHALEVAERHARAARRAAAATVAALAVVLLAGVATAIVLPLLVLCTSVPLP